MTVEELKIEAKKLGYNIIKKQEPIKLMRCICGNYKPVRYWAPNDKTGLWYYVCPKCDLKANKSKTKYDAKKNWNELIKSKGVAEWKVKKFI